LKSILLTSLIVASSLKLPSVFWHRAQIKQLHRWFDKCSSLCVKTDLVELHSVWSVSRRCTSWSDCLSVLSWQHTAAQISRGSVSYKGSYELLWVGRHRARYV